MLTLRSYQADSVAAVYDHLRQRDDNPAVVIPTGGGKTPVMATICRDAVLAWNGRVLILAHVKELLQQSVDKLKQICPELPVGVYSAGLKRRDTKHSVIVAGIQSVYKRACDLDAFDLILVDEAHLIPLEGDGTYRQFLADAKVINPRVRVIGFTATPFRMKTGPICTDDGILNHICYEVGVRELIVNGYLCPLVTKAGVAKADFGQLHVRAGEFVADEVEDLMDGAELVDAACAEIVSYTADRKAVLIFASGVKHGQHIVNVLAEKHGIECGFITGETPDAERKETLGRFRQDQPQGLLDQKPLKYLCNVNVLTTGFDAPHIDCVALVRPTLSPGLYYQMVGRGFRIHPSKTDCLVLDFGGNVLRHGPVDQIKVVERSTGSGPAPAKECPQCHSLIACGYTVCPDCGYKFPDKERRKHAAKASSAGILSGQVTDTEYDVLDVTYHVHEKRGAEPDAPKSMRVDYRVSLADWKSEWICFEHEGFARQKAIAWWRKHSPDPVPDTAEQAVDLADAGALAHTESIKVRSIAGDKFDRIIGYKLGPMPEPVEHEPVTSETFNLDDLDIPF